METPIQHKIINSKTTKDTSIYVGFIKRMNTIGTYLLTYLSRYEFMITTSVSTNTYIIDFPLNTYQWLLSMIIWSDGK